MYVEDGAVRMSVLSHNGKEAVVPMLEAGQFFGEPCLCRALEADGNCNDNRSVDTASDSER